MKIIYRIGNNVTVLKDGKVMVGTTDNDIITTVGELTGLKKDWNNDDVRKTFTEYLKGIL